MRDYAFDDEVGRDIAEGSFFSKVFHSYVVEERGENQRRIP
jgi:hypothetical protein